MSDKQSSIRDTPGVVAGDYTQSTTLFKIRKGARYLSLFGLSRTLAKIKGQYHMKATTGFTGRWTNPDCAQPNAFERNVAVIGCGNFAFSNIAYYLRRRRGGFLRAAFDIEHSRSRSLTAAYGGAYATADWTEILRDDHVKLVFISSNHASHAEYAIACLDAGKHVHIEKPHVVSGDQLQRLEAAIRRNPQAKVFLGFNRPQSRLFRQLQRELDSQPGPLMINWFVAGHAIAAGHWYYNDSEGGRVLGNLCHWTDLTLQMVSLQKAFPCRVIPAAIANAQSDFAVSILFADRSTASITFSAKGHTFEGVREVLNVHKGDILATLTDFHSLAIDNNYKKRSVRLRHRDHGHEVTILNSYDRSSGSGDGQPLEYVVATAKLFLAIRNAIETGTELQVGGQENEQHAATS